MMGYFGCLEAISVAVNTLDPQLAFSSRGELWPFLSFLACSKVVIHFLLPLGVLSTLCAAICNRVLVERQQKTTTPGRHPNTQDPSVDVVVTLQWSDILDGVKERWIAIPSISVAAMPVRHPIIIFEMHEYFSH